MRRRSASPPRSEGSARPRPSPRPLRARLGPGPCHGEAGGVTQPRDSELNSSAELKTPRFRLLHTCPCLSPSCVAVGSHILPQGCGRLCGSYATYTSHTPHSPLEAVILSSFKIINCCVFPLPLPFTFELTSKEYLESLKKKKK